LPFIILPKADVNRTTSSGVKALPALPPIVPLMPEIDLINVTNVFLGVANLTYTNKPANAQVKCLRINSEQHITWCLAAEKPKLA
jgi:hypothetical protein